MEKGQKMKWTAWDALQAGKFNLPPGYHVGLDADLMELRRSDGSPVAVFSARGASPAEVARTAEKDYGKHGKSSA